MTIMHNRAVKLPWTTQKKVASIHRNHVTEYLVGVCRANREGEQYSMGYHASLYGLGCFSRVNPNFCTASSEGTFSQLQESIIS